MTGDGLDQVREAIDKGDWGLALDLLAVEPAGHVSAVHLELLAQARYGNGDFELAVEAWERLHDLHVAAGELPGAARAAAMVAMFLMMDTGLMAPVRGWLRRTEKLLEGLGEQPAHALMEMTRAYERIMCGDLPGTRRSAELAIELGERHSVRPAVVIGMVASARVTILEGDLDEGLAQLDEVGALLMAGGADPLTTGMMYCELICAAQGLSLHDRAREWTEVMQRWRKGAAFGGINGRCRVHRAEMLRLSGPSHQAEAEAVTACEELRPWMRREFGWPLAELGTIRLRRGDLDGARDAFTAAHEHAWSPHPGQALLCLEEGDAAAAMQLITTAIEHPFDIPSKERPPTGELRLAPLFEAQAEIATALGDAPAARRAAERLAGIAARYPTPALAAGAWLAEARSALLGADTDGAVGAAGRAVAVWAELGAPYETAVARTVLAEAFHRAGNTHAAGLEWSAAAEGFATYGARRHVERARRCAAAVGVTGPAPAGPDVVTGSVDTPPGAVFRRDGDLRLVQMADLSVVVRDLVGFRHLERLLAEPARDFHALDLVAMEHPSPITDAPATAGELTISAVESGLPVIDEQARRSYERRLAEVEADIADAVAMNDPVRAELAERDRDFLVSELAAAVGLSGRPRHTGGSAERARTSVANSIRYALGRLETDHPAIAGHLRHCVSTGTYCSYTPDPLFPIRWEV